MSEKVLRLPSHLSFRPRTLYQLNYFGKEDAT
jgi:hypothetical protein